MYGGYPPLLSWLGEFDHLKQRPLTNISIANNLAPSSERAVAMALVICCGNLGGIMGSNIYLAREAPKYHTGFAMSLTMLVLGIIAVFLLRFGWGRDNKKREQLIAEMGEEGIRSRYTEQELLDLGHRSPFFRYAM